MQSPLRHPATAVLPSGVNVTAVTMSGTLVQYATLLSGMLHNRSFESREPAKKKRSSRGWNCIDVTKSLCLKQHRHSVRLTCQSLTVLSMDDERRKLFCGC